MARDAPQRLPTAFTAPTASALGRPSGLDAVGAQRAVASLPFVTHAHPDAAWRIRAANCSLTLFAGSKQRPLCGVNFDFSYFAFGSAV